jgi:hypothetical protein
MAGAFARGADDFTGKCAGPHGLQSAQSKLIARSDESSSRRGVKEIGPRPSGGRNWKSNRRIRAAGFAAVQPRGNAEIYWHSNALYRVEDVALRDGKLQTRSGAELKPGATFKPVDEEITVRPPNNERLIRRGR